MISMCPSGGARKIILDPILNFWSKLGTGVRERFSIPLSNPKNCLKKKNWGGGGRWASKVIFRFFGATFFFLFGLNCGSYGCSHHVKGRRDLLIPLARWCHVNYLPTESLGLV